jgi:hypothetical protein
LATPVDDDGPLYGVKVLDLTQHMAGPFCTMILADMGAEVIKLERPGKGDSVRAWGDGSERNPYLRYINRNKKGITFDYKQPQGKALFPRSRLAQRPDWGNYCRFAVASGQAAVRRFQTFASSERASWTRPYRPFICDGDRLAGSLQQRGSARVRHENGSRSPVFGWEGEQRPATLAVNGVALMLVKPARGAPMVRPAGPDQRLHHPHKQADTDDHHHD